MAKYCRFCTYATIDDYEGGLFCMVKKKAIAESTAKHTNQCKEYELINCGNDFRDLYGEKDYKEYRKRMKFEGQISLFEVEGIET